MATTTPSVDSTPALPYDNNLRASDRHIARQIINKHQETFSNFEASLVTDIQPASTLTGDVQIVCNEGTVLSSNVTIQACAGTDYSFSTMIAYGTGDVSVTVQYDG